jgi:hypothetical protein
MSIFLQVLPAGTETPVSASQRTAELIAALETYIGCAQRIPVYNEIPRRNTAGDIWRLTWPRWNLGNHEIKLNNEIIDTGFTLSLDSGTMTFSKPLHPSDKLFASYNFRMFSQMDMIRFLSDALSQINLEPPGTNFNLDTVPDTHVGILMMGASKNALKHLLFCLAFQEPATIFGGPDRVKDAISTFQSLKENNEKEFATEKKQIKKAVYPRIAVISVPEHTLPGGRCLTPDTTIRCIIRSTETEASIADAYLAFRNGSAISVLSQLDEDRLGFMPISKIWKSGEKEVWILTTKNGHRVTSSREHLFYSAGHYLPIAALKHGDRLLSVNGNRIIPDAVESIARTREKVVMYDIEVPSTANLFANGVKCHNSRWFRYLFSSGTS